MPFPCLPFLAHFSRSSSYLLLLLPALLGLLLIIASLARFSYSFRLSSSFSSCNYFSRKPKGEEEMYEDLEGETGNRGKAEGEVEVQEG